MNKVILMGRLTRDPDVRYSNGEQATAVARFTLAVDRRVARRDGEQTADFIGCVAFGRTAEFVEKYFRQGMRMVISGRIQTGSYTNRDAYGIHGIIVQAIILIVTFIIWVPFVLMSNKQAKLEQK